MPVMNVSLLVDEKTYAGVKAGVLEICGMAKNIESKRVAKHIPVVTDAAKEGASKAIDLIRSHKKETILISGVIIVGGAVYGSIRYFSSRNLAQKLFLGSCTSVFFCFMTVPRLQFWSIDVLAPSEKFVNFQKGVKISVFCRNFQTFT